LKKKLTNRVKASAKPGRRKYRLDELVALIPKKNRHGAVDWGKAVGKEVWS
jgi:antitoxin component of MazEF toxin-antitoxin module